MQDLGSPLPVISLGELVHTSRGEQDLQLGRGNDERVVDCGLPQPSWWDVVSHAEASE